MRYWVYINDKVIETPFEEGDLSTIEGFNGDTLVCKEKPGEGETQEWVPAKTLIEAYKQPVPPPPPGPNVLAKFTKKENKVKKEEIEEDNFGKEPKNTRATILSAKIFGDLQGKKEDASKENIDNKTAVNLGKTETLTPQEQAALEEEEKLKEDLFNDPPTELVSIDELEEFDVDNHNSSESESEEEVLKTAIRSVIYTDSANKTKTARSLKAVDIAHNKDIDLSDLEDEEQEESKPKKKEESKDLSGTELKPLGDKKPLTHLFDKQEDKESQKAFEETQELLYSEEPSEETPKETEQEETDQEEIFDEEEFLPEEEISIDDNMEEEEEEKGQDIVSSDKEDHKEVQTIMEELEKEKAEDEAAEEEKEEEDLEKAFATTPALVAETEEETISEEESLPEEEKSILEPSEQKEEDKKDHPTSLEELTGFPMEEEESKKQDFAEQDLKEQEAEKEEEQENKDVFIPTEIHPDVIVEELDEATKRQLAEEEKQKKEQQQTPQEQTNGDNFLNTFSSDIETVFLDQPTAFISDYIPPEETGDKKDPLEQAYEQDSNKEGKAEILDIKSSQGQHQVSLQNVRRVKPAAIKTVPMVDGEQADPFSKTQIRNIEVAEEAMAQVEKKNNMINLIKTFGLIIGFLIMIISFVALIAQIGVIPKDFSPLHAIFSKKEEPKQASGGGKKLTPEEMALKDLKDAEALRINKIVDEVKNYKLFEGITVQEKIKLMYPNEFDKLEWTAQQIPEDLTYYRVRVFSPANTEGYSAVNYLFNYNTVNYSVEATNSEANNFMSTPYKAPAGQTQQQAQAQQTAPAQNPQQNAAK